MFRFFMVTFQCLPRADIEFWADISHFVYSAKYVFADDAENVEFEEAFFFNIIYIILAFGFIELLWSF